MYIIVQTLLQPMCLGTADEAELLQSVAPPVLHDVYWVYGNARGLRQGSGDMRKMIVTKRLAFSA